MPNAPMIWVVGLDLRPSGQGAIRFAGWLTTTAAPSEIVGIHVLEHGDFSLSLRDHLRRDVLPRARTDAQKAIAAEGAAEVFSRVEVVTGARAEKTLEAACTYHQADALVVGRQAPRAGRALVRLGRVARRLGRSAATPVVIVAPDYTPPTTAGPVVLATDVRDSSSHAARFAASLAARMGQRLIAVHVLPPLDDYVAQYIQKPARDTILGERTTRATAKLRTWLDRHAESAVPEVVDGEIVDSIEHVARRHGASLVVAGSRLLSATQRLLQTSIGIELASQLPIPVAIVPPPAERPD